MSLGLTWNLRNETMSSNPYESPREIGATPFAPDQDREKLRRVAKYQRWVLYALLANILLNIGALAIPRDNLAVTALVGLLAIFVVLVTVVSVFLLARELIHVVVAVLCAALMVIPCISLVTLLIVNQRATTYLQQRGFRVGFMGVDPKKI